MERLLFLYKYRNIIDSDFQAEIKNAEKYGESQ